MTILGVKRGGLGGEVEEERAAGGEIRELRFAKKRLRGFAGLD